MATQDFSRNSLEVMDLEASQPESATRTLSQLMTEPANRSFHVRINNGNLTLNAELIESKESSELGELKANQTLQETPKSRKSPSVGLASGGGVTSPTPETAMLAVTPSTDHSSTGELPSGGTDASVPLWSNRPPTATERRLSSMFHAAFIWGVHPTDNEEVVNGKIFRVLLCAFLLLVLIPFAIFSALALAFRSDQTVYIVLVIILFGALASFGGSFAIFVHKKSTFALDCGLFATLILVPSALFILLTSRNASFWPRFSPHLFECVTGWLSVAPVFSVCMGHSRSISSLIFLLSFGLILGANIATVLIAPKPPDNDGVLLYGEIVLFFYRLAPVVVAYQCVTSIVHIQLCGQTIMQEQIEDCEPIADRISQMDFEALDQMEEALVKGEAEGAGRTELQAFLFDIAKNLKRFKAFLPCTVFQPTPTAEASNQRSMGNNNNSGFPMSSVDAVHGSLCGQGFSAEMVQSRSESPQSGGALSNSHSASLRFTQSLLASIRPSLTSHVNHWNVLRHVIPMVPQHGHGHGSGPRSGSPNSKKSTTEPRKETRLSFAPTASSSISSSNPLESRSIMRSRRVSAGRQSMCVSTLHTSVTRLGLAQRVVTLVVFRLHGFVEDELMEPLRFQAINETFVQVVDNCVRARKGVLHSFDGGVAIAHWNAHVPISAHTLLGCRAACEVAIEMQSHIREWRSTFRCTTRLTVGVTSGTMVCGHTGSASTRRYNLFGPLWPLCHVLCNANLHLGTTVLATKAVFSDARYEFRFRTASLLSCEVPSVSAAPVYELVEALEPLTTRPDEWLYELDRNEKLNPFNEFEQGFTKLISGEWMKAMSHFTKFLEDYHNVEDPLTNRLIEMCKNGELRLPFVQTWVEQLEYKTTRPSVASPTPRRGAGGGSNSIASSDSMSIPRIGSRVVPSGTRLASIADQLTPTSSGIFTPKTSKSVSFSAPANTPPSSL